MQKFNYHTHTYRCKHAERNIKDEEIVKEFIKKGFKTVAFTDHCPQKNKVDKRPNMRMDYSQREEYLNSIKKLQEKYSDKIKIETGYEIEYLPGEEENLRELISEVDKTILGQHFIYDEDNRDLKIFRYANFTDQDLIKYAEYISKAMELKLVDIIAHPDLFMLNRTSFGENEAKVAHMICSAAEKYNIPLEINLGDTTSYYTKSIKDVRYPCKEFWKIASNYNIKILYGIDAHFKNQIKKYEKTIKLVNKIIGENTIKKLNFVKEF